jgi:serpin B
VPRRALTAAEVRAVRASNAFAFDLLREVGAEAAHRGRNLVLSPYGGAAALGMTLNGAAGDTRAGMQQALGLAGETPEQSNATFTALTAYLLGADPRVTVRTANSVWAAEGFAVRPSFAATVRDAFDAEARTVRFGTPAATEAVNAWARDRTAGRIPKVFDPGSPGPETVVLLVNALYFKGAWATRFDPAETRDRPFRLDGVRTATVPTMVRAQAPLRVGRDASGAQVAELDYGDGAYAMTLVLPPAGVGVEAYAAALTPARWDALIASLADATMRVELPKFRLAVESRWEQPLIRLGMADAFSPRADFSPLSDGCPPGACRISLVKQNVDVQVDEEGTTAAAVTSVGIERVSLPAAFAVDRPFLFAVRERGERRPPVRRAGAGPARVSGRVGARASAPRHRPAGASGRAAGQ